MIWTEYVQGDRNPFIDHPEWVACVFNGDCEFCPDPQCPADLDCDGDVGAADLADLHAAWRSSPGHPADVDGDRQVDAADWAELLADWVPCL